MSASPPLWNGRNEAGEGLPIGVYFCKPEAGSHAFVKKMILLRQEGNVRCAIRGGRNRKGVAVRCHLSNTRTPGRYLPADWIERANDRALNE